MVINREGVLYSGSSMPSSRRKGMQVQAAPSVKEFQQCGNSHVLYWGDPCYCVSLKSVEAIPSRVLAKRDMSIPWTENTANSYPPCASSTS